MSTVKDAFRLLFRSKILIAIMTFLMFFCIWESASWYGKSCGVTEPLGNAMTLSIYLYIIMLFVSYEFFRKYYNNGIAETILVTKKGKKRVNYISAFVVLTLYAIVISFILGAIVIAEYLYFKIEDPNNEYIIHIIWNIIVNDFIIMEIGCVIGASLAVLRHRVGAYVVMTFLALVISPYMWSVANLFYISGGAQAGKKAYGVLYFFNLMPRLDLKWLPLEEFGEPLLPYRLFIMMFWIMGFITFICFTRKFQIKYRILSIVLCILALEGYLYPSSRVEVDFSPSSGMGYDFAYCMDNPDFISKNEKADYSITQYNMELSIKLNLSAKVDMKVSESKKEYKMTLYHKYKVNSVFDQDGNEMEFKQNYDYLAIKNIKENNVTNIIINYKGSAPAFYSNYQGCYLPGYFAYYPRAGYIELYDMDYGWVRDNFVEPDTLFVVKIDSAEDYISNLKLKDGVFSGQCDGFTLIKGFYKKKDLGNGNTLVYKYLDNNVIHDGIKSEEECWEEFFAISKENLQCDGITNTMIFPNSALGNSKDKIAGKNQVFLTSEPIMYY
ncbi:MAG: hypothetical protein IIT46_12905 [Lachnospiraceae bacterium]|nr:hypothetical protein [Lachnospiraceae bacterium]